MTNKNLSPAEQNQLAAANEWFIQHQDEFIRDLSDWIRIPSVSDETQATTEAPYGPQVQRIFQTAARKAKEFGLVSLEHEGRVLEIRFDEKQPVNDISLVSHLDVVPAGEGWTTNPFESYEKDGFIIGRGSHDNKYGALVDLYLLRYLKEHGIRLHHPIRILYGGAEETTLSDMEYYVSHYGTPYQAIVTDSPFPANNAQKGHLVVYVDIPAGSFFSMFHCGLAANIVPQDTFLTIRQPFDRFAEAFGTINESLRARLSIKPGGEQDAVELTAHGITGHSAFPANTINPIPLFAEGLLQVDAQLKFLEEKDKNALHAIATLFKSPYATNTELGYNDEESGRTTQNLGLVRYDPEAKALKLTVDIRYSVTRKAEKVQAILESLFARYGATITSIERSDPYYVPPDDPRLQTLLSAYNDYLGTSEQPNSTGGGTHARVIPNALNFGPSFGDHTYTDGTLISPRPSFIKPGKGVPHGADEWMSLHDAELTFAIYLLGITRLDAQLNHERKL